MIMEQSLSRLHVPDSSHERRCFRPVYEGETFMNDHSFIHHNGVWHLFHIWLCPDSDGQHAARNLELAHYMGHATSRDLIHWERQPDILKKAPEPSWESGEPGGSASYAIVHNNLIHLFYSRYRIEGVRGTQQIGLATSPDGFDWTVHPDTPVFHPASFWCPWEKRHDPDCPQPLRPECCRDPHVIRVGDQFIMYYVAVPNDPPHTCAIGHCVSTDLVHWEDRGPVYVNGISEEIGQGMMESPCVIEVNGRWHHFFTQYLGLYMAVSDSPFVFSEPRHIASTHASEIFPDGDGGWLISNVAKKVGCSHQRNIEIHTRWLSLARITFDSGGQPTIHPLLSHPAG